MSENPKVFISHASEDKERFVMKFATKLRSVGIDAWIDKWEMLSGDSLVDKIFEDGIKEADSFIVVLSINSINKPLLSSYSQRTPHHYLYPVLNRNGYNPESTFPYISPLYNESIL